jgi:hypothetical protein
MRPSRHLAGLPSLKAAPPESIISSEPFTMASFPRDFVILTATGCSAQSKG